jgi:DNA-binding MarR family transcriptional regulator
MTDREAAWRAYFESSARLQTTLDRELRAATGLNLIDYNVLLALEEATGHRLRMGELAEALVFSPSRLTYQVTSMEQRGLVRREPCPEDRRGMTAVLTDAGHAAFGDAWRHHRRGVQEYFLDHLSDDEVAVVDRVFSDLGTKLTGRRPSHLGCSAGLS